MPSPGAHRTDNSSATPADLLRLVTTMVDLFRADSGLRPPRAGASYSEGGRHRHADAIKTRLVLATLMSRGILTEVLVPESRYPGTSVERRDEMAAQLATAALDEVRFASAPQGSRPHQLLRYGALPLSILERALQQHTDVSEDPAVHACQQSLEILDDALAGQRKIRHFDDVLYSLHGASEVVDENLTAGAAGFLEDPTRAATLATEALTTMSAQWGREVTGGLGDEFSILDDGVQGRARAALAQAADIALDSLFVAMTTTLLHADDNSHLALSPEDIAEHGLDGAVDANLALAISETRPSALGDAHNHRIRLDSLAGALYDRITEAGTSTTGPELGLAALVEELEHARTTLLQGVVNDLDHGRHREVKRTIAGLNSITATLNRSLSDMRHDVEQVGLEFADDEISPIHDRARMTINRLSRDRKLEKLAPSFAAMIRRVAWERSSIEPTDPAAVTPARVSWSDVPPVPAGLSTQPFSAPLRHAQDAIRKRRDAWTAIKTKAVRGATKVTAVTGGLAATAALVGAMFAPAGRPGQTIVLPNGVGPAQVDETPAPKKSAIDRGKVKIETKPTQQATMPEQTTPSRDSSEPRKPRRGSEAEQRASDENKKLTPPKATTAPAPKATKPPAKPAQPVEKPTKPPTTEPTKPPVTEPEKPQDPPQQTETPVEPEKPEEPKLETAVPANPLTKATEAAQQTLAQVGTRQRAAEPVSDSIPPTAEQAGEELVAANMPVRVSQLPVDLSLDLAL
jgi:hypothetical protein